MFIDVISFDMNDNKNKAKIDKKACQSTVYWYAEAIVITIKKVLLLFLEVSSTCWRGKAVLVQISIDHK